MEVQTEFYSSEYSSSYKWEIFNILKFINFAINEKTLSSPNVSFEDPPSISVLWHLKFDETESHFEKFQISFVFDCSIEQQNSLLVIEYKVNIGSATYNDTANVNPKGITEIVLWNIESSKISNYLIDGSLNVEAHCTLKMLIPKSIKKESQYLSTEITDLGVPKDYLNRYRYSFSANDDERNIHAF